MRRKGGVDMSCMNCMNNANIEKLEEMFSAAKNGTDDILSSVHAKRDELLKNARDLKDYKANDLLAAVKLNEILKKNEEPEKKKSNPVVIALAVIGAVAAVAAIAYAVYRYFTPDYLEDFDDDQDFDDDDDFFEDEEAENEKKDEAAEEN